MHRNNLVVAAMGGALALGAAASTSQAAYLIEIDTDGSAGNSAATLHSNFSFGGDTTTASLSIAANAVGLTGGNSIFGGDGASSPDTYVYTYSPGLHGDNLALTQGTALNDDGDTASGAPAGGSGLYNVYAVWPFSGNVSGGLTSFTLTDGDDNVLFSVQVDQAAGDGTGDEWVLLGTSFLDADSRYILTQEAGSNTFVSMRASAVMFDVVPEPASVTLLALGGAALLGRRRR